MSAQSDTAVRTWRCARAWIVLIAVTMLGTTADLASKSLAFASIAPRPVPVSRERVLQTDNPNRLIPPHDPKRVVPGALEFSLVLNRGAVFGLGAGRRVVFIIFTFAALAFGVWMFGAWTRPNQYHAHVAIGLLMAGGLGNLYDRVVFACVRDFIHPLPGVVYPFAWPARFSGQEIWPYVSNVADLFLLIGLGALAWTLWRSPAPPKPEATQNTGKA